MKAYDIDLEMRLLRSSTSSTTRMNILSTSGGENLFHYSAAREIYSRASRIIYQTGQAPKWVELRHDSRIPESIREMMPRFRKPITDIGRFRKGVGQLVDYARIRAGAEAALKISEVLKEESVDPDEITDILTKAAGSSQRITQEEIFRHFGRKGSRTGKEALHDLKNSGQSSFMPTGFKSFDTRSRGLPRPSLVVVASESGGGKTKLAGQLRLNLSRQGFRGVHWSLEMDFNELEMRLLSQLTQIPMEKFLYPERLTPKEDKKIIRCYDEYQSRLREVNSFSSFAVPQGEIDIRSILEQSEPYKYDFVIIDYLSLLSDSSDDQQWRALSEVARYAKRWSASNNCCVILLAQLKDDETLKLSKSVKDHANLMFSWAFKEREEITRIWHIRQQKARNQPMYDFYLKDDTDTMTVRDCTEEELTEYHRTQTGGSRGKMNDYEKIKNRR